jgi:hypothetical protein
VAAAKTDRSHLFLLPRFIYSKSSATFAGISFQPRRRRLAAIGMEYPVIFHSERFEESYKK